MNATSITRRLRAARARGRISTVLGAVQTHMTNSRLTDPEILEWRFPVLLEEFSIRRGSGGAGRHKGGDGTTRAIRFREKMGLSILSTHRIVPPFGLDGGSDAALGENEIRRADGRTHRGGFAARGTRSGRHE